MKSIFRTLFSKSNKIKKQDQLFFMKTENVLKTEENKSGVIVAIKYDKKYLFEEIKLSEPPIILTKKQGVSKVIQDLEIKYCNPGSIFDDLLEIKNRKKGISILHISSKDKSFLYGEHQGLEIVELTRNKILLEGEEADVFFTVDNEIVQNIIHQNLKDK